MDGGSGIAVASAISALTPLAIFLGRKCMEKVRPTEKIQKHLVLIPPVCGKSTLAKNLAKSGGWIICDLDEDVKTQPEYPDYEEAVKSSLYVKADLIYFEMAERIYKEIRARCRRHKVKSVFFSSCYRVARLFSADAVISLAPDSESFESRIKDTPIDKRDELRHLRQMFLDSLPSREFAVSYHSLDELISSVRNHLKIRYTI